jgi:hypothetical protein
MLLGRILLLTPDCSREQARGYNDAPDVEYVGGSVEM